jgi:beta-fructofuranosidase
MKEWTQSQRYTKLQDAKEEDIINLKHLVKSCKFRFNYHIQPPTGLLNDPNGLFQKDGVYHVFYQWFPLGAVHGLKYWYHITSKDLINWEENENIISPDTIYDSHGAYSGSALVDNNEVCLFYTGNVRDTNWQRESYQILAKILDNGNIVKNELPIILNPPEGYTHHFRDPKVWKENGAYYMVIGAQRNKDETGCILIYSSTDKNNWKLQGEMLLSQGIDGYMWECPDLFSIDNKEILLFCPQGLSCLKKENENIYPSVYTIGTFNIDNRSFCQSQNIEKLDYGFDFYAPQTFLDEKGERILIGWMGVPEIPYPTDSSGWAHALTLPRVLSIKNERLYQNPVKNIEKLRKETKNIIHKGDLNLQNLAIASYEINISLNKNLEDITFYLYSSERESLTLSYNKKDMTLTLDRTNFKNSFGEEYGTKRIINMKESLHFLKIYRDTSSIEIFVNDGLYVMSGRFFPQNITGDIKIKTKDEVNKYELSWYKLEK